MSVTMINCGYIIIIVTIIYCNNNIVLFSTEAKCTLIRKIDNNANILNDNKYRPYSLIFIVIIFFN